MIYANRFEKIADPTVMNLLKLTETPGIISFAGGTPSPQALPLPLIKEAFKNIDPNPQYTPTQGIKPLLESVAQMLNVNTENVLITSGSQQALDLIGRVFINSGDKVHVADPTYFVALYAFNAYNPIYTQNIYEAKLAYVIPNFANPTGNTMDLTTRKSLADSQKLIIEDDPYGQLFFKERPPQSIYSLNSANVIYLTSLSKIVSPALRIGIVVADADVIQMLTRAKTGMDLCTSGLSQQIANYVLTHNDYPNYLEGARKYYSQKCQVMLDALGKHMPKQITWTKPTGGMFIWVTYPENIDTHALYTKAIEKGIAFVPGYIFRPNEQKSSSLRLSYALPTDEQIEEGIKTLSSLSI